MRESSVFILSVLVVCLTNRFQVSFDNIIDIDGFKEWKILTFQAIADTLQKDIVTNIVSIGDSQIEIDATYLFAK